jgi:hypothetical protein
VFDALDLFHAPLDEIKMKNSLTMAQLVNAFNASAAAEFRNKLSGDVISYLQTGAVAAQRIGGFLLIGAAARENQCSTKRQRFVEHWLVRSAMLMHCTSFFCAC